jgi:hypothetical protein
MRQTLTNTTLLAVLASVGIVLPSTDADETPETDIVPTEQPAPVESPVEPTE